MSNYSNEYTSEDYNNGENPGQTYVGRRTKQKRVHKPITHTTKLNTNLYHPDIPMQQTKYATRSRNKKVFPKNRKSKIQKKTWVDEQSQMLNKAKTDLESAFNTLLTLNRKYVGKNKQDKTRKNITPAEITIGNTMSQITSIMDNLDEIIPPAPTELPPPRPPQGNNNSLYSSSSNNNA
jgi:hypothetical protein